MSKEDITQIIAQGEAEQLALKKGFEANALMAINTMANNLGGMVLIGVMDTGSICGVSLASETMQNSILANYGIMSTQKTAQKSTKELIVELLKENRYYTKEDLMKLLQKTDGSIKEHLANLKQESIIKRLGGPKMAIGRC